MKLWRGLYLYTLGDLRCFIIVIVHLEPSLAFHSWCKQWRLIKEKPAQSQINGFDHLAVFTTEDAASVWGIFVAGLIACTFMFMYIFGRNIKWIPQRWFTNVCSAQFTVNCVECNANSVSFWAGCGCDCVSLFGQRRADLSSAWVM